MKQRHGWADTTTPRDAGEARVEHRPQRTRGKRSTTEQNIREKWIALSPLLFPPAAECCACPRTRKWPGSQKSWRRVEWRPAGRPDALFRTAAIGSKKTSARLRTADVTDTFPWDIHEIQTVDTALWCGRGIKNKTCKHQAAPHTARPPRPPLHQHRIASLVLSRRLLTG